MDRIEKLKDFLKQNPADSFVQHALALEYIKLGDDAEGRKLKDRLIKLKTEREVRIMKKQYESRNRYEKTKDRKSVV